MTAGHEHLHRGIRATASPPVWLTRERIVVILEYTLGAALFLGAILVGAAIDSHDWSLFG